MTVEGYIEEIRNAEDMLDIDEIVRNVLKEREMPQGRIGQAIFDKLTGRMA